MLIGLNVLLSIEYSLSKEYLRYNFVDDQNKQRYGKYL